MKSAHEKYMARERRRKIKAYIEDIAAIIVIFAAGGAILIWGEIAQAIVAQ